MFFKVLRHGALYEKTGMAGGNSSGQWWEEVSVVQTVLLENANKKQELLN